MTRPRLNTLTSLRYFFAMGLVTVHLLPVWAENSQWPPAFHNLLNAAYIGLPFFYVLSGFVLFYSYQEAALRAQSQICHFLIKRFVRLAPIFYLSLLLGGTVLVAEKGYGTTTLPEGAGYLAINLAFLSAWLPKSLVINFPTWSISVEMFCYFLFPFLLGPAARMSRTSAWLGVVACFCSGAAIQIAAALAYPSLWQWPWMVSGVSEELTKFLELHPLVHFPEFLFGIFLARLWESRNLEKEWSPDLLLAMGFLVICALFLSGLPWPFLMLTSYLFLPAIGLLIWGGAGARGKFTRWLELPFFLLLGEASYAVYCFHAPLSYWASSFLLSVISPYWIFFAFAFFLTLAAVVAHLIYDQLLRRALIQKLGRWR